MYPNTVVPGTYSEIGTNLMSCSLKDIRLVSEMEQEQGRENELGTYWQEREIEG